MRFSKQQILLALIIVFFVGAVSIIAREYTNIWVILVVCFFLFCFLDAVCNAVQGWRAKRKRQNRQ